MANLDLFTLVGRIAVNNADALSKIGETENKAKGAAERIAGGMNRAGNALTVGVTGPIVAVGTAMANLGRQSEATLDAFQTQLGASADEAALLKEQALEVFGNNFADSLEDAAQGLIKTRQIMRGLADEDLGRATENAFRLKDVFGAELPESLNAANTLMENFGLTQEEAFDFLTTGFQSGLNAQGDFLESVSEYAVQFGEAEATAGQFFAVLESGQSAGVLGTDKAADAFKEFRLRIADASAANKDALEAVGIDAERFYGELESGAITVTDAFGMVNGALNQVDNDQQRLLLGAQLIGTQYEDLGSAAANINTVSTALEGAVGATAELDAKYSNIGDAIQGAWRKILVAVEPVGVEIIEIVEELIPLMVSGANALAGFLEGFAALPQPMQRTILAVVGLAAALGPVLKLAAGLVTSLGTLGSALGLTGTAAAGAGTAAAGLAPILGGVKAALVALTGPVGIVIGVVGALAAAFITDFGGIRTATVNGARAVGQWFGRMGGNLRTFAGQAGANLANARAAIGNFVTGGVASLRSFAVQTLALGANIVGGIISGIRNRVGEAYNAIAGFGRGLLDRFKSSLRIASPSRDFEDETENIQAGIAQNLATSTTAEDAVADKAEGMKRTFADVMSDLNESLDVDAQLASIFGGDTAAAQVQSLKGAIETAVRDGMSGEAGFADLVAQYQQAEQALAESKAAEALEDTYNNLGEAMSKAGATAMLFGDQTDALNGQMTALKSATNELLDQGLSPNSSQVQQLTAQYQMLEAQLEQVERAERIGDIFNSLAESSQRAYLEQQLFGKEINLNKERLTSLERAITALLDEGLSPMSPQIQKLTGEYQHLAAQVEATELAAAQQENFSKLLSDITGLNAAPLDKFDKLKRDILAMGDAAELSAAQTDMLLDSLAAEREIDGIRRAQEAFTSAQEKYLELTEQAPSRTEAQIAQWETMIDQFPELEEGLRELVDGLLDYQDAQAEMAEQNAFNKLLGDINDIGRETPSQFDKARASVAELAEEFEGLSPEEIDALYDAVDSAEARVHLADLQKNVTDLSGDITKLGQESKDPFEKLEERIIALDDGSVEASEAVNTLLNDLANTRALIENRQAQEALTKAQTEFTEVTGESVSEYAHLDKETQRNIETAQEYLASLEQQIEAHPRAAEGLRTLADETRAYIDAQLEAGEKQRRVEGIFEATEKHTGALADSLSGLSPLAGEITGVFSAGAGNILSTLQSVGVGGFKAADAFTAMGNAASSSSNLAVNAIGSVAGAIGAFASGDIAGGITAVVTGAINLIGGLFRRRRKAAEEARKEMEALTDATQDYYATVTDLRNSLDALDANQVGRLTTYFQSADFNSAGMERAKELLEDFIDLAGDSLQVVNDLSEQTGLSFNADVERGEFDLFDFDSLREVSPFLAEQGNLIEEKLLELREQVRNGLQTEETERELDELTASYKQFSEDITDSVDFLADSWAGAFDDLAAKGVTEGSKAWHEMGDSIEEDFNKFYAEKIRAIIIQAAITNAQLGLKMAEISRLAAEAVKTGDWSAVTEAIRTTGAEMRTVYENAISMANDATAGLITPTIEDPDTEGSTDKFRQDMLDRVTAQGDYNEAMLEQRVQILNDLLALEEEHGERYKEIKADLAAAEEELNDHRATLAENRYEYEVAQGNVSLQQQLTHLEDKLAAEEAYSDEWMRLQGEIDSVRQQMHDEEQARLDEQQRKRDEALAHEKELAENRYEVMRETGEITEQEHLNNLWLQLDGLEKYSDEWLKVWREIRDAESKVQDERLELQKKAAEQLEKQQREAEEELRKHEERMQGDLASAVSEGIESGDWQQTSDNLLGNVDNFVLKAIDEGVSKIALASTQIPQLLARVRPMIEKALESGDVGQLRSIVASVRAQANKALGAAASMASQVREAVFTNTFAGGDVPTIELPDVTASVNDPSVALPTSTLEQAVTTTNDPAMAFGGQQVTAMQALTDALNRVSALTNIDMSGSSIFVREESEYEELVERLGRDLRARGVF